VHAAQAPGRTVLDDTAASGASAQHTRRIHRSAVHGVAKIPVRRPGPNRHSAVRGGRYRARVGRAHTTGSRFAGVHTQHVALLDFHPAPATTDGVNIVPGGQPVPAEQHTETCTARLDPKCPNSWIHSPCHRSGRSRSSVRCDQSFRRRRSRQQYKFYG